MTTAGESIRPTAPATGRSPGSIGPTSAFAHLHRMRDPRFPHEIVTILPGEYFVSDTPLIVQTVLGSCVSACIRDPVVQVGGMNHFMLPAPKEAGQADAWGESTRYGSHAMEVLINEILKRGGQRGRLEVKLFGGGKIYEGNVDVGASNCAWVTAYLAREGLRVSGADIGDACPRKVYYFTNTGKVLVKRLEPLHSRVLVDRERTYAATLGQQRPQGEVTLF